MYTIIIAREPLKNDEMQGEEELLTEPYLYGTVKEEVTKSTQQCAFFSGSLKVKVVTGDKIV